MVRRGAYAAILVLGIVSLLGDFVYEGGRAVIPGYLPALGASAFVLGLVGGLGDAVSQVSRLATGYLADRTRAYWPLTIAGYSMIAAIPLLALAASWEAAALLILLERLGKALRTPARDAILSFVGKEVGAGKAFGIHEFLDQLGAVAGPLAMALILLEARGAGGYSTALAWTLPPFAALMVAILYAYGRFRHIAVAGKSTLGGVRQKLGRRFTLYTAAVSINTLGLIYILLIPYKAEQILSQAWAVPLIYLAIQLIDAPVALLAGHWFDKTGVRLLALPFVLSIPATLMTLYAYDMATLIAGAAVFGVVLGMQESIYRASVAVMTPEEARGSAYGVFSAAYGISLMGSGAVYGYLLQAPEIATAYVVITQLAALTLLRASTRV
ncbi:MAG: MFS transporter [Aigarchaeota archaeon]|nr:MFS transporter [Candidatus Pelearchaeum maunauluense]